MRGHRVYGWRGAAEPGGCGAPIRMIVQGLDGKRVSVFVDGMLLGASSEVLLDNMPLDQIDHVEVYKGVVPAQLAGDGLGGAINIVTKHHVRNALSLSYEWGSYSAHRANVAGTLVLPKPGLAFSLTGQLNIAKNDYSFHSPFEVGQVITRDHDRYRSATVRAGITATRWWFDQLGWTFGYDRSYDELQGGLMNLQRNVQHAFTMPAAPYLVLDMQ